MGIRSRIQLRNNIPQSEQDTVVDMTPPSYNYDPRILNAARTEYDKTTRQTKIYDKNNKEILSKSPVWDEMAFSEKIKKTIGEVPFTLSKPTLDLAEGVGGITMLAGAKETGAGIINKTDRLRRDIQPMVSKPTTYNEDDTIFNNPGILLKPEFYERSLIDQSFNIPLMMATGGTGVGFIEAGGEMANRFRKAKERGERVDWKDQAFAGTIGVVNGYLEKIGFDAIFKTVPGSKAAVVSGLTATAKKVVSDFVKRTGNAAGSISTDMLTEYLQESIPIMAAKIVYDEGGSLMDVVKEANKQGLSAASSAFGAGAVATAPRIVSGKFETPEEKSTEEAAAILSQIDRTAPHVTPIISEALDTAISSEKVESLTQEEKTAFGIFLDKAKSLPGANVELIDSNLKMLESIGVKIPVTSQESESSVRVTTPATTAQVAEYQTRLVELQGQYKQVAEYQKRLAELQQQYNQPVTPVEKPVLPSEKVATVKDVEKTVDPLLQEAKKYKSAEEFVKSKGEPLFHATRDTKMKEFDPNYDYEVHNSRTDVGQIRDYETPYGRVFLTNDIREAKAYGQNVLETYFNGKPRIKTIKTGDVPPSQYFDNEYNWGKLADTVENSQADMLKFVDNNGKATYLAFPDKLQTKSQLTDLYNKAQGGVEKPVKSAPLVKQAKKVVKKPVSKKEKVVAKKAEEPKAEVLTTIPGADGITEVTRENYKENRYRLTIADQNKFDAIIKSESKKSPKLKFGDQKSIDLSKGNSFEKYYEESNKLLRDGKLLDPDDIGDQKADTIMANEIASMDKSVLEGMIISALRYQNIIGEAESIDIKNSNVIVSKNKKLGITTVTIEVVSDRDDLISDTKADTFFEITDDFTSSHKIDGSIAYTIKFIPENKSIPGDTPMFFNRATRGKDGKFTGSEAINKETVDNILGRAETQFFMDKVLKETNPHIRMALTVEAFSKIGEKLSGSEFDTLGEYMSEDFRIRLSRAVTKETLMEVLRHEIRHHAFMMFPKSQKEEVVKWWQDLSMEKKIEIFGSEDIIMDYQNKATKYAKQLEKKGKKGLSPIEYMADEAANRMIGNKEVSFGSGIVKAYREMVEKIALIFDRMIRYWKKNKNFNDRAVINLYNDVFKQIGGKQFAVSPKKIRELMSRGLTPGAPGFVSDDNAIAGVVPMEFVEAGKYKSAEDGIFDLYKKEKDIKNFTIEPTRTLSSGKQLHGIIWETKNGEKIIGQENVDIAKLKESISNIGEQMLTEGEAKRLKVSYGTKWKDMVDAGAKQTEKLAIDKQTKLYNKEQYIRRNFKKTSQELTEFEQNVKNGVSFKAGEYQKAIDKFKRATHDYNNYYKKEPTTYYRGGKSLDNSKITEKGISLTTDKNTSSFFNHLDGDTTREFTVDKDANILEWKDVPKKLKNIEDLGELEKSIIQYAKNKNYDGVNLFDSFDNTGLHGGVEREIRIFNPDVIKTKAPSTDLYNKAQGESQSMAFIAEKPKAAPIVTDKGTLRVQEVFNSAWKKLYGVDAPKEIISLLNVGFGVSKAVQTGFVEGKRLEKDRAAEKRVELREANSIKMKELRTSMNKMFKEKSARENVVKGKVIEYIKESLPVGNRGKFLRKQVILAKTYSNLEKIKNAVDTERLKYERNLLRNSIEKITSKIHLLPVEFQKDIISIVSQIELKHHTRKLLDRIKHNKEVYDSLSDELKRNTSRKVFVELKILERTPWQELSLMQLMDINNKLQQMNIVGRYEMAVKKGLKIATTDEMLSQFERLTTKIDVVDQSRRDSIIGREGITKGEKFKTAITEEDISLLGTDRAFDMFDGTKGTYDGPHMQMKKDIDERTNSFQKRRDQFENIYRNATSDIELVQENPDRILERKDLSVKEKAKFLVKALKLNEARQRRIGAYVYELNGMKDAIIENGQMTLAEFEEQKALMTESDYKVVEFFSKEFKKIYPELADAYAKNENKILGNVGEHFWPLYPDNSLEKPIGEQISDIHNQKNVQDKSLNKRVENSKQKLSFRPLDDALAYMDVGLYYIEMAATVKKYRSVVDDPRYKKAVGNTVSHFVDTWLKVIAKKGGFLVKPNIFEIGLRAASNNLSTYYMGWNPTSYVKQYLAWTNGVIGIGVQKMALGTKMLLTPDGSWRNFIKENSPEMVHRAGGETLIEDLKGQSLSSVLKEKTMKPLQAGDYRTASTVWLGAYSKYMEEHNLPLDKKSANKDAVWYADHTVRKYNGTAHYKDVPQKLVNAHKVYWRAFFAFQTFGLSNWSQLRYDIPQTWSKDKLAASQQMAWWVGQQMASKGITAAWIAILATVFGTDSGDDDEETSMIKLAVLSIVEATPYIDKLASMSKYKSQPVPILAAISELSKNIGTSLDFSTNKNGQLSVKMKTRSRAMLKSVSVILGLARGVPPKVITKMIEEAFYKKKDSNSSF